MTYYDEQLQRLQAQTARAKQLESMLRELRGQQAALSARVRELDAVKRKEQVDVDRLEGRSLAAFFYNVIGIPLAAGMWYPIFGWKLNPMFGAAAMSLSSFCVVTNALRLNWFRLRDASKDKSLKMRVLKEQRQEPMQEQTQEQMQEQTQEQMQEQTQEQAQEQYQVKKEETKMTKTMKIEGMMCGHCEARVKKCLEALAEVDGAEVSHETKTAVVTLNGELADEVLKKTVEDQDYKVLGIE